MKAATEVTDREACGACGDTDRDVPVTTTGVCLKCALQWLLHQNGCRKRYRRTIAHLNDGGSGEGEETAWGMMDEQGQAGRSNLADKNARADETAPRSQKRRKTD